MLTILITVILAKGQELGWVYIFFVCVAVLCSMWDLSSSTRDQTHAP